VEPEIRIGFSAPHAGMFAWEHIDEADREPRGGV
jgi:hypothetical protein